MATETNYTCDVCGRRIAAIDARRFEVHVKWETSFANAHACTRECASTLLRQIADRVGHMEPLPRTVSP